VSALFGRENPPPRRPSEDDTAEIHPPATIDPHDSDLTYDLADAGRARLRPTTGERRIGRSCCSPPTWSRVLAAPGWQSLPGCTWTRLSWC
jgi:hypothetical protein